MWGKMVHARTRDDILGSNLSETSPFPVHSFRLLSGTGSRMIFVIVQRSSADVLQQTSATVEVKL